MLCREIITVFSQIHTKHTNTLRGQNVECLNVKPVVRILTTVRYYSDYCAVHRVTTVRYIQ